MSFDTKFCVAIINGKSGFQYWGYDWEIQHTEDNTYNLTSEYWDRGFPHTYLFKPKTENGSTYILRNDFINFRDSGLIDGDLQYKILATLAMPYEYKLLLYSLVKLPKLVLNKELHKLKTREEKLYDELVNYIKLYEGSPLFYEDEWQRLEKLKRRQNKKLQNFPKKQWLKF